jgi:hypothetical protein
MGALTGNENSKTLASPSCKPFEERRAMTERLIINLPFEGFYESRYSGEIDHIEEREAEWAEERQKEDGIPTDLWLLAPDFSEVLFDCTDYSAAYLATAKAYVDAFNAVASDHLDMPLALEFESMDSPREYNFATDRVYAFIGTDTVKALFAMSEAEDHKRLEEAIEERFTSRSGFISGYDNELASWLERDVTEWDHNELCTLLGALLSDFQKRAHSCNDFGWTVFEGVTDGDGLYNEWSNAVDWEKYDARVQELRDEKLAELRENDPDYVEPPYRCPFTLDLFESRDGRALS